MCDARYKFILSDEILEKAVTDLNEPQDNTLRLEEIDKLKNKFEEKYKETELGRKDDAFLLRFLRSCEFDMKVSLATLICYHKLRQDWREVFELVENKSLVRNQLTAGTALPLLGRAKDKSFVLVKRPGYGHGSQDTIASFIASVFLSYETLLENEEVQIYGITIIVDVSHLGFRMGVKLASVGKKFLKMIQEVLPIRVMCLNIVKEGFVFDMIFKIVGQLMNTELRRKLKLHGSNFENLHKIIEADVLPPFLDGTGPKLDADNWSNKILDA